MPDTQKPYIILFLCINILAWTSCSTQRSVTNDPESGKVDNVNFTQEEKQVYIYYDLHGKDKEKFTVNIKLKNKNGNAVKIDSTTLKGDVGKNIVAGNNKRIVWNIYENYPNGLKNDKVQFVVFTSKTSKNNRSNWYYYAAGGALLLGAGSALLMIMGGDKNGSSLPPPPSRP